MTEEGCAIVDEGGSGRVCISMSVARVQSETCLTLNGNAATPSLQHQTIGHSDTPRRIPRRNHRFARRIDPEVLESFRALTLSATNTIKSVTVTMERRPPIPIHGETSNDPRRLTGQKQMRL
jgi:hypothetical protein